MPPYTGRGMDGQSAFLRQFDSEFAPRLGARAETFRSAFCLLGNFVRPIIVETGCVRVDENWAGDGQSTVLFDAYVAHRDGFAYSVDISSYATTLARQITKRVTIETADSVAALSKFPMSPIDLLYLDSFDFDANEPMKSATHHLFELTAAMKSLVRGSIVMVDDTSRRFGKLFGKGMLVAQYMEKIGVPIAIEGECQVAWTL